MLTSLGFLVSLLLAWFKHCGDITCMWWMVMLPLPIGVVLDILVVGLLYWYNEVRKK